MTPHPATDSALKAVERWTGHDNEKRAARDACGVMVLIAILVVALIFLSGCMTASGNKQSGDWRMAALGTDAAEFNVGPGGMDISGLNQSASLAKVADIIKGMWSNTLTGMAVKYSVGKYYDAKGAELDAAKSVDLEQLRNAKSVTDATAAQKALETKLAAEAAASGQLVPGM